ncbi:MAG TPA: hypothetical protein VEF76_07315 [Patescibacteria group bacterium]|nr:hypothetical protein [Patescibacteria group bacterium]
MFRKMFNRAADSFDQVDQMVTRKLPIPDLENTDKNIQFTATRDKLGHWTITSKHNLRNVTYGLQQVSHAFTAAVEKHTGRKPGDDLEMNFDSAFLILKDMEESLLKYRATAAGEEPKHHYMAAYRLLPEKFREGLDDLFFNRTEKKGQILPSKAQNAAAQPASRHQNPPKPGPVNPGRPN